MFVKAHLNEALADSFELVLATPKKISLSPGMTLAEAMLVPPASLVHLKLHKDVSARALKSGYLSETSQALLVDGGETPRVPKGVTLSRT